MHPVKYGAAAHHNHQQQHRQQQQQLMNEDGSSSNSSSSVFSISNPQLHHHSLNLLLHHPQSKQPHIQTPLPHQQLFQQQQFQPFHHHHLHQQPFLPLNFKLGLNENTNSGEREAAALALNHHHHHQNDNAAAAAFLHGNGNEQHVPETRRPQPHQQQQQHSLWVPQCWHPQEDSPIKEPFWKALNRQCSGDEEGNKYKHVLEQPAQCTTERSKHFDTKYTHFGELEAIYGLAIAKPGQTASGSALTGENSPKYVAPSQLHISEVQGHRVANGGGDVAAAGVDHGSENSIGEDQASTRKADQKKKKKKRKRRVLKEQLSSMVGFFESLVKQVTDHQEGLHKKFLGVIERMDKERTAKEESWRREEAEKLNREAFARAHQQALATRREAIIVSHLEKITGERLNLPPRTRTPLLVQPETAIEPFNESTKVDINSRWPRAEVEALIQVRCNLESKFREPGLKGPLWEEVSSFMASLGYQRSAKRCKEKWENINKYFRKSKENGKKRSQQSKTCTYFEQLDQLYSRIPTIICPTSPTPLVNNDNIDQILQQQGDSSDLLEAYMPENDLGTAQVNASGSLKDTGMNSTMLGENLVQGGSNGQDNESHGNFLENESGREDDDDNDRDMGNVD